MGIVRNLHKSPTVKANVKQASQELAYDGFAERYFGLTPLAVINRPAL